MHLRREGWSRQNIAEALDVSPVSVSRWFARVREGGTEALRDVEMANLVCRDLEELHQELILAISRLRQRPQLIRAFFAQAGLKIQNG